MLAKRIIPSILCRGRTLVKGTAFDSWRSIGHAAQAARVHGRRGVDEILLLDVAATAENRGPDLAMVSELAEGCFIPITVGGGVRSLDDIKALLRAGADKVCIGSALYEDWDLLPAASQRFGRQALVASIDVRQGMVAYACGTKLAHDRHRTDPVADALCWALTLEALGAGEILLSSVDRDGTMAGYDLAQIARVSQNVGVPVIASGGCSGYEDMAAAFKAGADACAAGALFAFTDSTPKGAARFLHDNGVAVRCF